jgi:hypothetical protein
LKNTLLVFAAICLGALTLTAAVPTRPNGTSGPMATVPAGWPTVVGDTLTVGTSAIQLNSDQAVVGCVIVKADNDNTDDVWVGGSAVADDDGYRLDAGESTPYIPAENLNEVYVIGGAASQKVSILYGKP